MWPPRAFQALRALLPLSLLALTLLAGCAYNALHLSYPLAEENAPPAPGSPSVYVVLFTDQREKLEIGEYRNRAKAYASSRVDDWLTHAFISELSAGGLRVRYAATREQALQETPDYFVTGVIDELWLQESGITKYSCTMRCTLTLFDAAGTQISRNTLMSTVTRAKFPLIENGEPALTEAAQELLRPAARITREKLL